MFKIKDRISKYMFNIEGGTSEYFKTANLELEELSQKEYNLLDEDFLERLTKILANIENGNKFQTISEEVYHKIIEIVRRIQGIQNQSLVIKMAEIIAAHKSVLSARLVWDFLQRIKNKYKSLKAERVFSAKECEDLIKHKLIAKGLQFEVQSGSAQQLEEVLVNFLSEGGNQEMAFVLRACTLYPDNSRPDRHVMPLILRKIEGKIEILCTDSVGREEGGWIESLTTFLKEKGICGDSYNLNIRRQRDPDNCAIFVISDICQYVSLKNKNIDLFSFAKEERLLVEKSDLTIYDFKTLPPQMMKLTQSFSQIREYAQQNPTLAKRSVKQKSPENLENNIGRHSFFAGSVENPQLINSRSDIKWARYCAILIKNNLTAP